jgi:hypothetical protein
VRQAQQKHQQLLVQQQTKQGEQVKLNVTKVTDDSIDKNDLMTMMMTAKHSQSPLRRIPKTTDMQRLWDRPTFALGNGQKRTRPSDDDQSLVSTSWSGESVLSDTSTNGGGGFSALRRRPALQLLPLR